MAAALAIGEKLIYHSRRRQASKKRTGEKIPKNVWNSNMPSAQTEL